MRSRCEGHTIMTSGLHLFEKRSPSKLSEIMSWHAGVEWISAEIQESAWMCVYVCMWWCKRSDGEEKASKLNGVWMHFLLSFSSWMQCSSYVSLHLFLLSLLTEYYAGEQIADIRWSHHISHKQPSNWTTSWSCCCIRLWGFNLYLFSPHSKTLVSRSLLVASGRKKARNPEVKFLSSSSSQVTSRYEAEKEMRHQQHEQHVER